MNSIGCYHRHLCKALVIALFALFCSCRDAVAFEFPVYVMKYHDEAYKRWEELNLKNGIKGAVLIHIDAHDDLATDKIQEKPKNGNELKGKKYWEGSFIHPAVRHGLVSEIWIVFPDSYPIAWYESSMTFYSIEYHADENNTFYLFNNIMPPKIKKLEGKVKIVPVSVHFKHIGKLPDFSKEKRPVFLDFDADYFANSGDEFQGKDDKKYKHVVMSMMEQGKPENEINEFIKQNIRKVLRIIKEKGVKPAVVTIAESPDYTVERYKELIIKELQKELELLKQ